MITTPPLLVIYAIEGITAGEGPSEFDRMAQLLKTDSQRLASQLFGGNCSIFPRVVELFRVIDAHLIFEESGDPISETSLAYYIGREIREYLKQNIRLPGEAVLQTWVLNFLKDRSEQLMSAAERRRDEQEK